MKHSFRNDYSELAHPRILEAFSSVGNQQFESYGLDKCSANAASLLRKTFNAPSADIHFISGGTQANLVAISSILRPHEAVIAPTTGHIFVHEAGAIEATGHKVCTREGHNGKLRVVDIESILDEHTDEHMVKPRLVYISLSTECGTVYTKSELTAISEFCRANKLFLYVDGARLGSAINSPACDLTYSDVAALVDIFFVGGTKNGALFGEAIVICNDKLKSDFRFHIKQHGAMLAKGATIGLQFETLFKDGLYDELAEHSGKMAKRLADGIRTLEFEFLFPPETNLIIPIFTEDVANTMHQSYDFYDWQKFENTVAVRLLTSWATTECAVDEFLADLKAHRG